MRDVRRIKLAAMWSKATSDHRSFYQGKLNNLNIAMYPNKYKTKENQPDYFIYIEEYINVDVPKAQTEQEGFGAPPPIGFDSDNYPF